MAPINCMKRISRSVFSGCLIIAVCLYLTLDYNNGNFSLSVSYFFTKQSEEIEICSCSILNKISRPKMIVGSGTLCQSMMSDRGLHQKVVSYCLGGDVNNNVTFNRYFSFLDKVAQSVADMYPGWTMRIYHKYDSTEKAFTEHLCSTYCRFGHVDLCNVTDLGVNSTSPLTTNLAILSPVMWRFLPIADNTVDLFVSRDLDSVVTEREAAAVNFWLNSSNATLHVMRDHPYHVSTIMAGMWGARMELPHIKNLTRSIFLDMKNKAGNKNYYGLDQELLNGLLYATIGDSNALRHESYACTSFPKSSAPFPTKRIGHEFVGARLHKKENNLPKCPIKCRPKLHLDWDYC